MRHSNGDLWAALLLAIAALIVTSCGSGGSGDSTKPPPACALTPASLAFGTVTVGDSLDKTFVLTNQSDAVLSGQVQAACAGFAIAGSDAYSLGSGEADTFTVRFRPRSEGALGCAVATGSPGCAQLQASGNGLYPRPPFVYGVIQVPGQVIFEFNRVRYTTVTNLFTGDYSTLSGVGTITTIVVAGDFNAWDTSAWPMVKVSDTVYRLPKDPALFAAQASWEFKFLINGAYWVEPPGDAVNRVPTGLPNGSYNLVLTMP